METPEAEENIRLVKASKGKRFANYLIDALCFYLILILLVVIYFAINPYGSYFDENSESLLDYVFTYLVYVIFYVAFEASIGQTPGKLLTKTKVLTAYGETPALSSIIGRSFARLIPFEAFSFLGDSLTGWHDNLSKTIVVDLRESILPTEENWGDDIIDANL